MIEIGSFELVKEHVSWPEHLSFFKYCIDVLGILYIFWSW